VVKILGSEVLRLAIPFRLTFRHALAERDAAESVVVRLEGDNGMVGHGECAPRRYVTGETCESVERTLATLLPRFLGASFSSLSSAVSALEEAAHDLPRDRHAAFCALELAVLDLVGRSCFVSSGEAIGPVVQPTVHYSGVVSADEPDAVRAMCERLHAIGIRSTKLKVGRSLDDDLAALRIVRAVLGDAVALRVDANCAWTADEALARLQQFAAFRLDGAEQPVAADDVDGMAWLTARSPVPIVADESLVSVHDAERLVAARACHVFNVRISKCGGLLTSRRIRDIGARAGIGCIVGCQVGETALLSAAGRHLSTRTADVLHHEGSFGELLLEQDPCTDDLAFGSHGAAPALGGIGLGVDVAPARLQRFTVHREERPLRNVVAGHESCRQETDS